MPRKIKARHRRATEGVPESAKAVLVRGVLLDHELINDGDKWCEEGAIPALERLYKAHKTTIYDQFWAENGRFGRVPHAFWVFEVINGPHVRGWFDHRKGAEREHETLERLGLVKLAQSFGYNGDQ